MNLDSNLPVRELLPSVAAVGGEGLENLNAEARTRILQAAARCVEAALAGRDDSLTATIPQQPVYGIFVSLKNQGQLRACCGSFGQTAPLHDALRIAAYRSATSDRRFAPLDYSELENLELEVWLLHSPRRIEAHGEDRVREIAIGRHGLVIGQGAARGLLLPGVAVEAGMDAPAFLEAVCRKAQMPAGAWRQDGIELSTFEGVALRGRLRPHLPESWVPVEHPRYVGLLTFVREIWKARLQGAAPPLYWAQAADGEVAGVLLSAHNAASQAAEIAATVSAVPRRWSRLAPSGGLPLQTTVHQLAQEAMEELGESGVRKAPDLAGLQLRMVVLNPGLPHSLLGSPDGPRFDPRREALYLEEGQRRALVLPPQQDRRAMFEQACRTAQVSPASMGLTAWTFPCIKLEENGRSGKGAKGQSGARSAATSATRAPTPSAARLGIRPPSKAGLFYPAEPEQLHALVQSLLSEADTATAALLSSGAHNETPAATSADRSAQRWPAVMVPHAGLRYSGALAAKTLRRVEFPDTAIIIGPKHTPKGLPWAIDPHEQWSIPGGTLECDRDLAEALAGAIPNLVFDKAAHEDEHAIEVELPFLHALAPRTKVVGIALTYAALDDCQRFAERLAEVLRDRTPRPLLVISSDMNHFAPEPENRRRDRLAIEAMLRLDPAGLYETVRAHQISMCGVIPAVIVLETLRQLGQRSRAELVGYSTSAAVTGDAHSVVGYCGMLFG